MADPALDHLTELVRSLVGIMQNGQWPAVDLADERAVLEDAGQGAVGIGEASGLGRAKIAAKLAIADLRAQLKHC